MTQQVLDRVRDQLKTVQAEIASYNSDKLKELQTVERDLLRYEKDLVEAIQQQESMRILTRGKWKLDALRDANRSYVLYPQRQTHLTAQQLKDIAKDQFDVVALEDYNMSYATHSRGLLSFSLESLLTLARDWGFDCDVSDIVYYMNTLKQQATFLEVLCVKFDIKLTLEDPKHD